MLTNFFSTYDKIDSWFTGKKFRKKLTNIILNVSKYLDILASEKGSVVQFLPNRGANIDQKNRFGDLFISIYLCIY